MDRSNIIPSDIVEASTHPRHGCLMRLFGYLNLESSRLCRQKNGLFRAAIFSFSGYSFPLHRTCSYSMIISCLFFCFETNFLLQLFVTSECSKKKTESSSKERKAELLRSRSLYISLLLSINSFSLTGEGV